VLQLEFNSTLHVHYGAPATVTVEYRIDPSRRLVNASMTWRNKTTTRIPEALTVFHRPGRREGYEVRVK
jgi:hypothetical protein